ncbi:ABC transporter permease [Saccharomonospora azurea]|uniref:ABC transporter permease n=1 Tax=Saccharomonospora azurea TaxID=40988 RepID=UPI00240A180A|nr:ABC transporter permease [Saccharomonospora azurea]
MRGAAAIAAKDLRQNSRSAATIFVGIVTPFLLILLMDLLVGGVKVGGPVPIGVLDQDRSTTSAEFSTLLDGLEDRGVVEASVLAEGDDPVAVLDDRELAAVVVVPDGFGDAVTGDSAVPPLRVIEDPNARVAPDAVAGIVSSFTQRLDHARVQAAVGETTEPVDIVYDESVVGGGKLDIGTQLAVAMTSLFLLITLQFGGTGVHRERQEGTLARLLAAPVRPSAVVGAKALATFVVGTVSTLVLVGLSALTTSAEWGSPLGVAVLVVALAAAATGIVLIVNGVSRTADGATNLLAVVALTVGMFGSGLVPLPRDGVLGALVSVVPHHWFYEGIRALSAATEWTAALPYAGVLCAFAAVFGTVGVVLVRRRLAA